MASNLTDSSFNVEEFLDTSNRDFALSLAPTLAYLVFLMAAGLVGNTIVFLVYYKRFKPSATRTYILAMSVCDLLNKVLALPSDVFEICFHYDFDNVEACKFFGFITRFLALFGGSILVAIALDRYRTVCQPTKKQKSPKYVYVELSLCGLFAVCLGSPFTVLRGLQNVDVENTNITGVTCSIDDVYVESSFFVIYNLVTGVTYFIGLIVVGVSYGMIGRHLWHHKKSTAASNRAGGSCQRNTQPEKELDPPGTSQSKDISSVKTSQEARKYTASDDETDNDNLVVLSGEQHSRDYSEVFSNLQLSVINQRVNHRGLILKDKLKNSRLSSTPIHDSEERCFSSSGQDEGAEVESSDRHEAGHSADRPDIEDSNLEGRDTKAINAEMITPLGAGAGAESDTITTEPRMDSSHPLKQKPKFKQYWNKAKPSATKKIKSASKISRSSRKLHRRTTLMMFALAAISFVNYVPYVVVAALLRGKDALDVEGWVLNLEQIALRSFFINSAVNPLVYGFCSMKFRKELYHFFSSKRKYLFFFSLS